MTENTKRLRILEAATKIFSENGYQYATISQIAKEAGISTGLMYSYFTNKLDLLLSIISVFIQRLNGMNRDSIDSAGDPLENLKAFLHNYELLLIKDENALHMVKVSNEALPHMGMIKESDLQQKRREISAQYHELYSTIDTILLKGQEARIFDDRMLPSVMRQVLFGSIERVINGLFVPTLSAEEASYSAEDAHRAIVKIIDRVICA